MPAGTKSKYYYIMTEFYAFTCRPIERKQPICKQHPNLKKTVMFQIQTIISWNTRMCPKSETWLLLFYEIRPKYRQNHDMDVYV